MFDSFEDSESLRKFHILTITNEEVLSVFQLLSEFVFCA